MLRCCWWAQSCGGRLLPAAMHPRGLSSPQWTCLPSCMGCPPSGRGEECYFIYFVLLKGAARHSQNERSGKDAERWDEGEWNAHRWMLAVFSPFKGHGVLLGTVLVSHPLIVPWPLACHPFEAAFTHPLSFSASLWPRTAQHVYACWLGCTTWVVSTFIFQPWIFSFKGFEFFFKWATFCSRPSSVHAVYMQGQLASKYPRWSVWSDAAFVTEPAIITSLDFCFPHKHWPISPAPNWLWSACWMCG